MWRYKLECRDVKGAPEMMRVTTTFLRGEVAASSSERKKLLPSWKQQEAGQKQNFKKGGFRNQQRPERKQDSSMGVGHTTDRMHARKRQIGRGNAQSRQKAVTFNQRTKIKQWERPGKGSKKRGNLRQGQAAGNPNGTTMAEGGQTKDYSNLLSRNSDFIPTPRGGGWDGGFRLRGQKPIGMMERSKKTLAMDEFLVVRSLSSYNMEDHRIDQESKENLQFRLSSTNVKIPVSDGDSVTCGLVAGIIPLRMHTGLKGPGTQ
ncbi:hypothetical protein Tco_0286202 [Tanacetum coccineum]